MYLEMLQQRYGAELEKQAMEKQALNPMQLIQMGRRFAAKGKLDRFGQLIAKRNNAIKNTDVFAKRIDKAADLYDKAMLEKKWLGRSGPVGKQYLSAVSRTPYTIAHRPEALHWLSKKNLKGFKEVADMPRPMGEISPAELADWSYKLHRFVR